MEMASIGNRIAQLRKSTKIPTPITQESLAIAVGVSVQAVSKWENGGSPDASLLPAIADYFGVSIDYLFGREQEPSTKTNMANIQELLANIAQEYRDEAGSSMLKNTREMGAAFFDICYAAFQTFIIGTGSDLSRPMKDKVERYRKQFVLDENGREPDSMMGISILDGVRVYFDPYPIPFFTIMPEPEGGLREFMPCPEELAALFAELSCPTTIKALQWIMQRYPWLDQFTPKHMAKNIGASEEETQRIIEYLIAKKLIYPTDSVTLLDGEPLLTYNVHINSSALLPLFTFLRFLLIDMYTGAAGMRWSHGVALVK